jgi:DNA-binding IclR family transcriptional regulator
MSAWMSEPVRRTLAVLEYFADHSGTPLTQAQIANACGISSATLNRIVKVLCDEGYVFRDKSRRYRCNVAFTKMIGADADYFNVLAKAISAIVSATALAAESIVVRGNEFEWHHKEEPPNTTLYLRARPGFRRNMNELDALSRLYLAEIGWEEVDRRFDTATFYAAGARHRRVTAQEARRIVEKTDPMGVAYDIEGNGNGVRRFATIIRDQGGRFLHLLSIAEAALPLADQAAHVRQNVGILEHWRDTLARYAASDRRGATGASGSAGVRTKTRGRKRRPGQRPGPAKSSRR